MTEKKLTAKQKAFCEEYLIDLNATQAAIRAKYSEGSARQQAAENMAKPVILEYIQELQEERRESTRITAEYVLNGLKTVADRCLQAEPVMKREDGVESETGEYKFEHSGANKAFELLGRHLALFTDKLEHSGGVTFVDDFGPDAND